MAARGRSLYTNQQVLGVTLFEKMPISQPLTAIPPELLQSDPAIQLHLFNLVLGKPCEEALYSKAVRCILPGDWGIKTEILAQNVCPG